MTSPRTATDPAAADRPVDALTIFCLLPTLNPYGGVISVVNAVNLWIAQGHRVQLASLSRHPEDLVHPRTEPIYVPDPAEIGEVVGGSFAILLATSWHTVEPIVALSRRGGVPWYYVQDYEPAFYEPGPTQDAAAATYARISNRVVKTTHLQSTLDQHGYPAHRIPPGMNLDIFYPRDVSRRVNRVLAMARPPAPDGTDHRGFHTMLQTYALLHDRRPDLELCVFGTEEVPEIPDYVTNFGRLPPEDLPGLYSSSAVFLDTSRWHGFGRTGLEAMACGTPVVLTQSGGVSEYARDGDNAVLVPIDDPVAAAEAVLSVIEVPGISAALSQAGRATALKYGDQDAARALLGLFRGSLAERLTGEVQPGRA